jgi:hypothetical protein
MLVVVDHDPLIQYASLEVAPLVEYELLKLVVLIA